MKSRIALGNNCDEHIEPLMKLKNGERDYDKAPLDEAKEVGHEPT